MFGKILTVGGYTLLSRLTGFFRDIMLAAIVGGIIYANWGIKTGRTTTLPRKLPWELRSGEITKKANQPSIGHATTNPSSIEPLALHAGFIAVTVTIAYFIKQAIQHQFETVSIPLFAMAFVVGIGGRRTRQRIGSSSISWRTKRTGGAP